MDVKPCIKSVNRKWHTYATEVVESGKFNDIVFTDAIRGGRLTAALYRLKQIIDTGGGDDYSNPQERKEFLLVATQLQCRYQVLKQLSFDKMNVRVVA